MNVFLRWAKKAEEREWLRAQAELRANKRREQAELRVNKRREQAQKRSEEWKQAWRKALAAVKATGVLTAGAKAAKMEAQKWERMRAQTEEVAKTRAAEAEKAVKRARKRFAWTSAKERKADAKKAVTMAKAAKTRAVKATGRAEEAQKAWIQAEKKAAEAWEYARKYR